MAYQYLADTGNDLVGLAQILGHENLNTTARYSKRTQDQLGEAAEKQNDDRYFGDVFSRSDIGSDGEQRGGLTAGEVSMDGIGDEREGVAYLLTAGFDHRKPSAQQWHVRTASGRKGRY